MILIITSHHCPLFERSGFFYDYDNGKKIKIELVKTKPN